jgi:hypothetical protein
MTAYEKTEAKRMSIVGHCDLDGKGDCMHVQVGDGVAYVGHMGYNDNGTSIIDVSNPKKPKLITQIKRPAGTHTHKVQLNGKLLLVNHERNRDDVEEAKSWSAGIAVYDVSDPAKPKQIGFYKTNGGGVHRMAWWEGRYCYASGTDDGYKGRFLHIVDMKDPEKPVEAGRWWMPGQNTGAGEKPDWTNGKGEPTMAVHLHHALPFGKDRVSGGYWDCGVVIIDTSDVAHPKLVSRLQFGPESINSHTAFRLPGRDVMVCTDEQLTRSTVRTHTWLVDVKDEKNPKIISRFPLPAGEPPRPHNFRWGPHNVHEMKPDTLVDPNTVYLTYFAGGLRAYDVTDAHNPTEIAYCVPKAPAGKKAIQLNDLTVTKDGLIYVSERFGDGLYIFDMER